MSHKIVAVNQNDLTYTVKVDSEKELLSVVLDMTINKIDMPSHVEEATKPLDTGEMKLFDIAYKIDPTPPQAFNKKRNSTPRTIMLKAIAISFGNKPFNAKDARIASRKVGYKPKTSSAISSLLNAMARDGVLNKLNTGIFQNVMTLPNVTALPKKKREVQPQLKVYPAFVNKPMVLKAKILRAVRAVETSRFRPCRISDIVDSMFSGKCNRDSVLATMSALVTKDGALDRVFPGMYKKGDGFAKAWNTYVA